MAKHGEGLRRGATEQADGEGFERPPLYSAKTHAAPRSGAQSGALVTPNHPTAAGAVVANADNVDPTMTRIIVAWPTLPAEVKAGVLARVDAVTKTTKS
jgi:hypothetical protein